MLANKSEELARIAKWLEMRGAPEYNLETTLTILERKIKTLRQRMMLAERLNGWTGGNSADCDLMAGQDIY
jgi:predicted DNA-binding protein (UPF0278 family)